jgi:haloalkane dehalogenase
MTARVAPTGTSTNQSGDSGSISADPRYEKKKVGVLGRQMAFYEAGKGFGVEDQYTIVFVHGNPTCAYMWRNVMPHCEGLDGVRVIAPDLIGMGDSEKLLDTGDNVGRFEDHDFDRYSLSEQSRYFSAFLDAVGVHSGSRVVFVGHSWGGTLAAHWGSKNPGAVRGFVSLEVVYLPFPSWERVPKKIRGGVKLLKRQPFGCCGCYEFDLGAHLVLKKNLMLESMSKRVNRGLTEEEMHHYRKPYPDVESRRPILAFVRSIPVAGEPAEVVRVMDEGRKWIMEASVPKLFVSVEPGTMMQEDRDFIRTWKNVTEVSVSGGHMVTEDSPDEVGQAIVKWFSETVMLS